MPQGNVNTASDGPASTLESVLADAGPHVARLVTEVMQDIAARLTSGLPKVLTAAVCLAKSGFHQSGSCVACICCAPARPGGQAGLQCSSDTGWELSSQLVLHFARPQAVLLSFCAALCWSPVPAADSSSA